MRDTQSNEGNHCQSGHFIVIAIFCLLVICIVLGLVYVLGHKEAPSKDTVTSQTKRTGGTDLTEGGKYLVISEWKVRFKLPDQLKGDVTYQIFPEALQKQETAYFQIGALAAMPNSSCKLPSSAAVYSSDMNGAGVYLIRSSTTLEDSPFDYKSNVSLGGSYYSIGKEKYSEQCVEEKQQNAGDMIRNLTFSLDSLERLPSP
jgi:hypothetical protein